jgi:biopolymer transport protein ExbD
MAGIDVGGSGGRRSVNQEINMIPFIDLLMVTVAFLLITAVWVNYERMNANAQIPGQQSDLPVDPDRVEKRLHLHIEETEFVLTWKQAATVVSETRMARTRTPDGKSPRYDDLAKKIQEQWKLHGGHMQAADRMQDRAIFHSGDSVPFKEIIAVMDALYSAKREMVLENGQRKSMPVFNMAFAVN